MKILLACVERAAAQNNNNQSQAVTIYAYDIIIYTREHKDINKGAIFISNIRF